MKSCYFEELVVAPNQDIDFSKPGQICLKVSYMGVVSEIEIVLAPDVEGVNKTSYAFNENTIDLFENGYFKSDRNWGEYTLVSNEPVIYGLSYFGWAYKEFITVSGDSAYQFNASMLEENLEEYTLFTEDGVNVAKVYTKNGLSFADIYSAEGYYRRTVSVKFTLDGKYVYALGIKYLIGEEYLVKYTVKALNDNPMSGETYVETETEETVSVEAYQKAIKANAKFDPSICEDGFGVDTSADGKTTLTFKVSATAKAQTLGLTETEAQSVLNPVISLTRNETRLLNMTISYETAKGNTVVISFDYEYAA